MDEIVYLTENDPQRVYLVTYSQLDRELFPTRQSFGSACIAAFGGNNTMYFACSEEEHEAGGSHYHVALRLKSSRRWFSARKWLKDNFDVDVNFAASPNGGMYAGAFRYAAKYDEDIHTAGVLERHPDLEMIGANKGASTANAAYRKRRSDARDQQQQQQQQNTKEKEKAAKHRRIDKLDIMDFVRRKNIQNEEQLMAEAEVRREAGDRELARVVANLGKKGRKELVADAWIMHNAVANTVLRQKSRLQILKEFVSNNDCICPSRGLWLALAIDVLSKNEINFVDFGQAVYKLLEGGRKKHSNVMLVGERNCAKTFLLDPLALVYKHTFHTPASSQFGWIGVENAQVIFLNDFRWVPVNLKGGTIAWDAMLRLLEGAETNLPAPMNSCADHIKLGRDNDIPVFATSRDVLRFYKVDMNEPQTAEHATENRMMDERWKVFKLHHVFEEEKKIFLDPCGFCFGKLVM